MASRRTKRRRARGASWPQFALPHLEQRHWDLLGLGLVAFAAFFTCIFYLDWAGGEVGEALADALRFLFGAVAYAAPVALLAAGAILIMRPALPSTHPFKTGALCLAAALTLGFAAGSLGLGPGDTPRDDFLDSAYLERHGGLSGESLYWASSKLFSDAGSHILFAFLLIAGVLLLTGASIASLVSGTRVLALGTGDRMRRTANTLNLPTDPLPPITVRRTRDQDGEPLEPPEPENREPVVRATHVEAPALDGADRYPDLFEEEDEDDTITAPEPEHEHVAELEPPPAPAPDEEQPEVAEKPESSQSSRRWASAAPRSRSPRTSTTGCRSWASSSARAAPRSSTRRASSGSAGCSPRRSGTSTWTRA